MTRYLTIVLLALGCSGAPDTGSPQDTPVHTGGAPAATGGAPGLGGEGGLGGSPAEPDPDPEPETEPEEPAPEPWKPEPRPEPLPGRPGFGDPCQRPSDCEIPGVTGENSMICHAGRCGFFCDRLQGANLVVSEYLERLCVSDYERVCSSTHTARVTCTR